MRRVADKDYTDNDIAALKERQLNRTIRQAEKAYNTPPEKFDIFKYTQDPGGLKAEDFAYTNPDTYETVIPSSLEEVDARFEEKYRKECKEFDKRPPFDPKNVVERFDEQCAYRRDKDFAQLPDLAYEGVDIRLIELEYLPAYAYERLRTEDRQREKRRRQIERAAMSDTQAKSVPKELKAEFDFHDGDILYLKKVGCDLEMLICENFPREGRGTPYIKVVFFSGKVIERSKNLRFGFDQFTLPGGEKVRASLCQWQNKELYKTDGGYEAHMLLATPQGYAYLTIACRDIAFEYDVSGEAI